MLAGVSGSRVLVVGAAVLDGGRLLATRRTAPPALAGRWELPGGKVEHGEEPVDALLRKVEEELGCTVELVAWLPGRTPISERYELAVAVVRLVAGDPPPREHDAVAWLGPDALDDVDWLEPDRPFLAALRERMAP